MNEVNYEELIEKARVRAEERQKIPFRRVMRYKGYRITFFMFGGYYEYRVQGVGNVIRADTSYWSWPGTVQRAKLDIDRFVRYDETPELRPKAPRFSVRVAHRIFPRERYIRK